MNIIDVSSNVVAIVVLVGLGILGLRTVKSIVKTAFMLTIAVLAYCYTKANPAEVMGFISSILETLGFSLAL